MKTILILEDNDESIAAAVEALAPSAGDDAIPAGWLGAREPIQI